MPRPLHSAVRLANAARKCVTRLSVGRIGLVLVIASVRSEVMPSSSSVAKTLAALAAPNGSQQMTLSLTRLQRSA